MSLRCLNHHAVGAAGEQAILQRRLGVQLPHQEQADDNQQQRDGDGTQAGGLAIRLLLPLINPPYVLEAAHMLNLVHYRVPDKAQLRSLASGQLTAR